MSGAARRLTTMVLVGSLAWVECACSQEARKARHLERADQYFEQKEYREAVIEYRNVLQIEEDNAHAIQQVGFALFELGQVGQAYHFLRRSKELSPENTDVRRRLATIYVLGRQPAEAREEANYILEIEPTNLDALVVLSEIAATPLEIDETIERLEEHRSALEDRANFHLALGSLYVKKGDIENAEIALREAANREPDSVAAHLALGSLHAARRNLEAAESEFKEAAELSPPASIARIRLADFYVSAGLPDRAKQVLTEITTEASDYVPAWRRLAQMAFDEKNYQESAAALDQWLKSVPTDPDALQMRGQIHHVLGESEQANEKFREAVRVLQEIVDRTPNFAAGHYRLAQAHLRIGEVAQAKTQLQEVKTLAPDAVEPILLLAELRMRTGEVDLAIQDLESLVENRPRAAVAYQVLAAAYLQKRNVPKAVEASQKVVELLPNDARGRYLLGASLLAQGQTTAAKRQLEAALSLSPEYVEPLVQLASLDFREGRRDDGIERVKKQIAVVPQSGAHQYVLGQMYAALGDLKQAEAAYLKAVELEPTLIAAYGELAVLFARAGRADEALARMEDAVAANPTNVQVLMLLGTLHEMKGDVPKAQQTYERLLELDANFAAAANNLAYIYLQQEGRLEEALGLAEAARQAAPDSPEIADTLGWVLYHRATYERSLSLLAESAQRLPENPTVQFHLGMVNLKLERKEAAFQALNRALELDSGFPEAEEARRALSELQ